MTDQQDISDGDRIRALASSWLTFCQVVHAQFPPDERDTQLRPDGIVPGDRMDGFAFLTLARLIEKGAWDSAYNQVYRMDTIIRDQIPVDIYEMICENYNAEMQTIHF